MKYINEELTQWAINEIENKYSGDIALLIGHKHWKIPIDGDEVAFNFFIPETDRGYELAKTFIIDDIGYDLFPMSWERVLGLANVNESITTCLEDGVILYAKDEEAKRKFLDLQQKLQQNLNDPIFTYQKGLEKISTVMDLYKNLTFETSLGAIRKASGYIVDFLSQGIATYNGTCLKRGNDGQIDALESLEECPKDFVKLYKNIVDAESTEEIKRLCLEIIRNTRTFFEERKPEAKKKGLTENLEELSSWYEEGTYTFRRIYYYCDNEDCYNSFAWGCVMQQEFDYLESELGLEKMDLMVDYHSNHLEGFKHKAKEIEDYIVSVLKMNNIILRNYKTLEEFLNSNG